MKSKILCLILFCCIAQYAKAQDKGTVIFDVAPLQATIKIDNQLLKPAEIGQPKTSIQLTPGVYKVQIWSFGMELYEEDVIVKANDKVLVAKVLKMSVDYAHFNKEMDAYSSRKRKIILDDNFKYVPIVFGSFCIVQTGINLPLINRYKRDVQYYQGLHDVTYNPKRADQNRLNYDEALRKYNNMTRFQTGINYVGFPLLVGLGTYSIIKIKKKINESEKPIFEDSSPFSNIDVNINLQSSPFENSQNISLVMTYKF